MRWRPSGVTARPPFLDRWLVKGYNRMVTANRRITRTLGFTGRELGGHPTHIEQCAANLLKIRASAWVVAANSLKIGASLLTY